MSKLSAIETSPVSMAPDLHAKGWDAALDAAMTVLSELERGYKRDRATIRRSARTSETQAQLLDQLEQRRRKEREPYVLALADLHQRMMAATFSQRLR